MINGVKNLYHRLQKDIELLSPAGTWEALVAAVQNGADAVYLGGKAFNARRYAGNFDDEQLKQAVHYCHVRGVKVYLTLNTLLNDMELEQLGRYVVQVYHIGIDAVIVQDAGVAKLIREIVPALSLHASTQMTVHNLEAVKLLESLGFDRVVPARELTYKEILYICQNTSMEIEVFVHGALCICYSGQCLMSSMIGGRSGNRGSCAQPCRLPYKVVEVDGDFERSYTPHLNEGHLLSPKDLSLINHIDQLKKAGVKSLKIEGRMKRPEYVAAVTGVYRKYLDAGGEVTQQDHDKLLQVFNRGGFTQGYFSGQKGQDMISRFKPNHWGLYIGDVARYDHKKQKVFVKLRRDLSVGDGLEFWTQAKPCPNMKVNRLMLDDKRIDRAEKGQIVSLDMKEAAGKGDKVYKTYDVGMDRQLKSTFDEKAELKKIPIYGHCTIEHHKPMHLSLWDEEGAFVELIGEKAAQKAVHREMSRDKVSRQLNKLGGTPFVFMDIGIDMEQGVTLPISEINDIRRKAIEMLEDKRSKREMGISIDIKEVHHKIKTLLSPKKDPLNNGEVRLYVQVHDYLQAEKLTETKFHRLYMPLQPLVGNDDRGKYKHMIRHFISRGIEVVGALPKILRRKDLQMYASVVERCRELGMNGLMLGNIGAIHWLKKYKHWALFGDFGLNIFNSLSVCAHSQLGLQGITLSPELTLKQIGSLQTDHKIETELIAYGRLPLMQTENDPVNACESEEQQKRYGLLDRKQMIFPILTDKTMGRTEILNARPLFLIDRLDEIAGSRVNAIRLLFTVEAPSQCEKITRLYGDALNMGQAKAIEKYNDFIANIKQRGFTRGRC